MSAENDLKGGSSSSLRLGDEVRHNAIVEFWRLMKKLGSGSFGDIFMAEHVDTQDRVAVKLEPTNDRAAQLFNEHKFYKLLGEQVGVPKVYFFGLWDRYNVLVMDLLGKNLEDVFDKCEHNFSLKTIVQVVIQLLTRFEYIHSKKIAYRDVKPENFLLGPVGQPNQNIIYVVDFGLSKEYIDRLTNRHINYREGKSLTGTARYMSINSHLGREQSRRDDLEALGHMFVYFLLKGKLPWSGLKAPTLKERYKKIGEVKQKLPPEELLAEFPVEFANYLTYTRNLQFEEDPNYEEMKNSFVNLFKQKGFENDNKYDWDNKLENE